MDLSAVLAAELGAVGLLPEITGLVSSPHPLTAAFAVASLLLGSGLVTLALKAWLDRYGNAIQDPRKADIELEKLHLANDPEFELEELTQIYEERGLDRALAEQVAVQLTAHNALDTHLRDELGLTEAATARPIQAAIASAASFSVGAALPLATVFFDHGGSLPWTVSGASLIFLALLGALGAWAGNAPMLRPVVRVTFWGAMAMATTIAIGSLFGAVA